MLYYVDIPASPDSVDSWVIILQAGRLRGSIPDEIIEFVDWPNTSSWSMRST
jgi:hypothetical protein